MAPFSQYRSTSTPLGGSRGSRDNCFLEMGICADVNFLKQGELRTCCRGGASLSRRWKPPPRNQKSGERQCVYTAKQNAFTIDTPRGKCQYFRALAALFFGEKGRRRCVFAT